MMKRVASILAVVLSFAVVSAAADRKSAERSGKAAQLKSDLEQLVALKALVSQEYWQENAVKGKSCAGEEVAVLIVNLAKHLGGGGDFGQALDLLKKRDRKSVV